MLLSKTNCGGIHYNKAVEPWQVMNILMIITAHLPRGIFGVIYTFPEGGL